MTREEALALLKGAYSGPASTLEGSFAGDVLAACADGLAQLWSMDIDGLARRAFVSTAVGEWLTAVCADRGVARLEGESDEQLRARTLEKLRSNPTSGNADHYRQWCTALPDILRARVLPLRRGAGTVDVVVADTRGRSPGSDLVEQAQAEVDRQRPVGADARVLPAEEVPISFAAALTLMEGAAVEGVAEQFQEAVTAYLKDCALQTNTVSYAKTLRLLLDCPGVADVVGFTLDGQDRSVLLEDAQVGVCGAIAFEEGTP